MGANRWLAGALALLGFFSAGCAINKATRPLSPRYEVNVTEVSLEDGVEKYFSDPEISELIFEEVEEHVRKEIKQDYLKSILATPDDERQDAIKDYISGKVDEFYEEQRQKIDEEIVTYLVQVEENTRMRVFSRRSTETSTWYRQEFYVDPIEKRDSYRIVRVPRKDLSEEMYLHPSITAQTIFNDIPDDADLPEYQEAHFLYRVILSANEQLEEIPAVADYYITEKNRTEYEVTVLDKEINIDALVQLVMQE